MEDPTLWDDPESAQKKMKTLASLKEDVSGYQQLVSDRDDILDMIEMADEEPEGHCGGRLSPLDSMQALKEIRKTDAAYNAPKAQGKEDGR